MVVAENPETDLRRDVELRFKAFGSRFDQLQVWIASIPEFPGSPQQVVFDVENEEVVVRLEQFRDSSPKQLLLVVGNPSISEGADIALEFVGSLVE